ncbi:MAG: hypothetical protein J5855_10765, partial [Mailhella sp.]|nr:hypothetical protein [Mailhella sp.]
IAFTFAMGAPLNMPALKTVVVADNTVESGFSSMEQSPAKELFCTGKIEGGTLYLKCRLLTMPHRHGQQEEDAMRAVSPPILFISADMFP